MKKFLTMFFALFMIMSVGIPVFAAEDTTPTITGVSITVDGVEYPSSTVQNPVVIKPDSTVTFNITGTNLRSDAQNTFILFPDFLEKGSTADEWSISADGTTATASVNSSYFKNTFAYELRYTNHGSKTSQIRTGIYLRYSDEMEEDKAAITGVSITVDDIHYTSSTAENPVVIRPDSMVIFTVTGKNLKKADENYSVRIANGTPLQLYIDFFWKISDDEMTAIANFEPSMFEHQTTVYEIIYTSGVDDIFNSTGIYLIYNNSTEPVYNVTIADSENGFVSADKSCAAKGEEITLTIVPDTDYSLDSLCVCDADNEVIHTTLICQLVM